MDNLTSFLWLNTVVGIAVKVGGLFVVTAAFVWLSRRGSAALRHWLWTCAMLGALVVPMVAIVFPPWQPETPVLHEAAGAYLIWPPEISTSTAAKWTTNGASVTETLDERPDTSNEFLLGTTSLDAPRAAQSRAPVSSSWMAPVLLLWASGGFLAVLWLLVGIVRARRLLRGGRSVAAGSWRASLSEAKSKVGLECGSPFIHADVLLLESAKVSAPALAGVFRSAILLPLDARTWEGGRQEVVLLHELAHARRLDNLTQLVASLACCLHWFNPLVWFGARQMLLLREHAADDAVLKAGAKASDYGDVLLDMARNMSKRRGPEPLAVSMARPSTLSRRIRHLVEPRSSRNRLGALVGVTALLATVSGALAVGAVGVDPGMVVDIEYEREASYLREALFAPGESGRAAEQYAVAESLVQDFKFYGESAHGEGVDYTAYDVLGTWSAAPAPLREIAASPEGLRVAELVLAGASRLDGKSSMRHLDWNGDAVFGTTPALRVRKVVDAVALRTAESGEVALACSYWLATARYGQDLARGSTLIGQMLGGSVEVGALMQIRRALDRYDMSDEGLRKVLSVLGRLVESQPALGDTLWVEALWRAQTYPELADLESWRVVIARLRDAASLSSQERSKLLGEMYILRQDPSLWSRYVGMADYFEASVRGTYLYVALHLDKRSRGQWAPSLEALVPYTISKVPIDPIAGAGFSYTVGTDSALLESAVAIQAEARRDRKQVLLTLGQH